MNKRMIRTYGMRRRWRVRCMFAWYDLWVGVYVSRNSGWLSAIYICPLPCCVLVIEADYDYVGMSVLRGRPGGER